MKDNVLLKVILWRICSISITLLLTFLWTGDIVSASGFTFFLHSVLIISHWTFEKVWHANIKN